MDKDLKVLSKILISDAVPSNGERISKVEKPDFETLELISENELVVFGSGSKSPLRDVFVRVLLQDELIIEKYDVSKFYNHLRNLPIFKDSELNIEATAFYEGHLSFQSPKKSDYKM